MKRLLVFVFAVVLLGSCRKNTDGCTDPNAINYNPDAVADNGGCIYTILGCMDSSATNYDPQATCDDSSCIYVSDCQADFNGNGQVDAGDLLTFLASFGLVCD